MSTCGNIIYETLEGKYIMRWHMHDSYISMIVKKNAGLGQILLEKFSNEKDINQLFSLNKHFFTITQNEKIYKEAETENIQIIGLEEHNKIINTFFDQILFMNSQVIKTNKSVLDDTICKVYDSLAQCLMQCEGKFVYLYKQQDKSWYMKLDDNFLLLKDLNYIDKKYNNLLYLTEVNTMFKNVEFLYFKMNKISSQILSFSGIKNNEKIPRDNLLVLYLTQLDYNMVGQVDGLIDWIKTNSDKYELYKLNKKLHKNIPMKPKESKKLKI